MTSTRSCAAEQELIHRWLSSEEESFGRTLEQGTRLLADLVDRAKAGGTSWIDARDAFQLHDTYGFPYDLTRELLQLEGLVRRRRRLPRADGGAARARAHRRRPAPTAPRTSTSRCSEFARQTGVPTRFVGYETTEVNTSVACGKPSQRFLVDEVRGIPVLSGGWRSGVRCRARGERLRRRAGLTTSTALGDDQAVAVTLERGELREGERVRLVVDRQARHATECNHTATHLLHAALRQRLGTHVRQAGSAVRPDKLRFDFTHGTPMAPAELRDVEDQVNAWILESHPVRALHTTRAARGGDGCDGAVRREVRRRGEGDRGRGSLARAVWRHACGGHVARSACSRSSARDRAPPTCAGSRRSRVPQDVNLLARPGFGADPDRRPAPHASGGRRAGGRGAARAADGARARAEVGRGRPARGAGRVSSPGRRPKSAA